MTPRLQAKRKRRRGYKWDVNVCKKLYHQHMMVPGYRGCSTQERGPANLEAWPVVEAVFLLKLAALCIPDRVKNYDILVHVIEGTWWLF
jgi:hypothetical protein